MRQHARWYRAILVAIVVGVALVALPAIAHAETSQDFETSITVSGNLLPDGYIHWYSTDAPLVSFFASITVEPDPVTPIRIGGFGYQLWRTGGVANYTAYAPVGSQGGPLAAETVDMAGWVERQTGPMPAGANSPIEGWWFLRAHSVAVDPGSGARVTPPEGPDNTVQFGIDVTQPSKVDTPVISSVVTSQGVVTGSIADFAWRNTNSYDSLSGVFGYTIKLNGVVIRTFEKSPISSYPTQTVTVESLAVGANIFEVAARDRAGNEGIFRQIPVYSKPGTPTISFSSPVGSSLTPTTTITAVASPGTIEPHVTITLDGITILSTTTAPFSVIPDYAHLAAGPHTLVATAVDKFGNIATPVTKVVNWTPPVPTISFTAPTGSSLTASAAVSVNAVSDWGNPSVNILIDGVSVGAFTSPPYSVVPDLRHLTAGTHTLTATATNIYGTATVTKVVTWDPPLPTVSIITPSGSVLTAGEAIAASVASANGNPTVVFRLDGVQIGSFTAAPYSVVPDLSGIVSGSHVLSVSATNEYGTTTVNKTVTWTTPVPTITWTSPTVSFLTLLMPISVDVASISTPTVTIAIDGVGYTFTGPPYSLMPDLNLLSDGAHLLTATATNRYGTTTISKTVTWDPNGVNGFIPSNDVDLNGVPTVVTSTNPHDPSEADYWWRMGWGKSVAPNFEITPPAPNNDGAGFIVGMLYTLDRSAATQIDVTQPLKYYRTARGTGTHLLQTIDVMGVLSHPPAGGWPALMPGAVLPEEGYWDLHLSFFTAKGFASHSWHLPFGIDRTPPRAVSGLKASPTLDTADADKWNDATRASVTWQQAKYDSLAGVGYYEVLVDDAAIIPDAEANPVQGRVYEIPGVSPSSITVEDMPPGKHKVSIVAVDRATNRGPAASTYFYSDPDYPGGTILIPSKTGVRLGSNATLSARATDTAGVSAVRFTIDSTIVGTVRPSTLTKDYTAKFKPNWSKFSNGTHTLTVTVFDMLGRTTAIRRDFVLDKIVPTLTIRSAGPNPFYPNIREGYKDNYVMKFKSSEEATASLRIYDSNGTLRRTITKKVKAGTSSLTWDGRLAMWSTRAWDLSRTYRFTVRVSLVDRAGNKRTSKAYKTSIKFFEIVKTGPDSAKIVAR